MKYFILILGYTLALKVEHLDYYVNVTVGETPVNLKLDTARSVSILDYEELNKNSTRYIDNRTAITETIKLANNSLNFTFLRGDELTLGLGYSNKYGKEFSIVDSLKEMGIISKSLFTINRDYIIFDEPIVPTGSCKVMPTNDLGQHYREGWMCDLSYILLHNGKNITNEIELDARVIFDYNSNYVKIPKTFRKYILDNFMGDNSYNCTENTSSNENLVKCKAKDYDTTIYLAIGDYAYRLSSQVNTTHSELAIQFTDEEKVWTLGRPFLKSYTVTFDTDNQKVGISGETILPLPIISEWYSKLMKRANEYFYPILISIISLCLMLIIFALLMIRAHRRKKLEEHGPLINDRN
jgi:hypothetical protein